MTAGAAIVKVFTPREVIFELKQERLQCKGHKNRRESHPAQ